MARVYLDHNGTSPMRSEVRERWLELLAEDLGNPSATHASGRRGRAVVDDARAEVAQALEVPEEWVLFTSGGTESNNLAVRGAIEAAGPEAGVAVTSVEHASVLEPARELGERGHPLWVLPVDERGVVDLDSLQAAAREPSCRLLSVILVNNELGTVAPMEQIAERLATLGDRRPLWHADAVQALGKVPLELSRWGTDLTSFSAHKVGGPPGVGVLVRRPRAALRPLAQGGGQEFGMRPGTESAAAIGAAALATRLACEGREEFARRTGDLARQLWTGLQVAAPGARLAGPCLEDEARAACTLNLRFEGVDGRTLVARLDLEGLEASLGSACASGALEVSHVLQAIGLEEHEARASLRLSMGWNTTSADIHSAVDTLGKVLNDLSRTRGASRE